MALIIDRAQAEKIKEGAKNALLGTYETYRHPIESAKGLISALRNPKQTLEATIEEARAEPVSFLSSLLTPVPDPLRLMKKKTYHGSPKPWADPPTPKPPAHREGWAVEGPGLYSTTDPVNAAAWGSQAKKPEWWLKKWDDMDFMKRRGENALRKGNVTVYELELPDYDTYLDLSNQEAIISALRRDFPEKELRRYYNHFENETLADLYGDLLPYKIGEGEWGDALKTAHESLQKQGVKGLIRPRLDRVLTYDPTTVKVLGELRKK